MSEPALVLGMRSARLEAIVRKALADAWAQGETTQDANSLAIRKVQEKFPKEPLREISKLIQRLRGGLTEGA